MTIKKNYNRNPKGSNQWVLRSNQEIQIIINKYPTWTKKDFRGEGKQNPKKENALLSRKETERPGLKFGHYGKRKASIKEIYKHSTYESIKEYENKQIDEDKFRNRSRTKKQRDLSIN